MMKKLLYIIPALLLLSCSKINEVKQEDMAKEAAKTYYEQLLKGDYNAFVEGSLYGDSVPADYKAELLTNAQMYVEQQQEEHQGIEKVEASRAVCDSLKDSKGKVVVTADAFLTMYFKDGSKEEISVPMVCKNQIWYLR